MPAPRALARRTPPGNPSGDVRVRVRVRWRLLTSPRVRPLGAAARVQAASRPAPERTTAGVSVVRAPGRGWRASFARRASPGITARQTRAPRRAARGQTLASRPREAPGPRRCRRVCLPTNPQVRPLHSA